MELKTIGLTKKFSSKTAVDNLNITLTNGVYGLLGANGAGKTTLMRLLCNIQNPTSGKILLNGKNIVGLGERYRNLLGYLPQHFGYYPDFSAFWCCTIKVDIENSKGQYIEKDKQEATKDGSESTKIQHGI